MVQFRIIEGKDFRYSIMKWEDGTEEKVGECDRIAAEVLFLEATEAGYGVRWIYPEDMISPEQNIVV